MIDRKKKPHGTGFLVFFLLFPSLSLPYTPPLLLYHRYISKHISKVRAPSEGPESSERKLSSWLSPLFSLLIPFGLTRFWFLDRTEIQLSFTLILRTVCAFIWSMKSEFSIVRIKFPRLSRHCTKRGFFFYVAFCSAVYICFPFHSRTDDGSGRWARAREKSPMHLC